MTLHTAKLKGLRPSLRNSFIRGIFLCGGLLIGSEAAYSTSVDLIDIDRMMATHIAHDTKYLEDLRSRIVFNQAESVFGAPIDLDDGSLSPEFTRYFKEKIESVPVENHYSHWRPDHRDPLSQVKEVLKNAPNKARNFYVVVERVQGGRIIPMSPIYLEGDLSTGNALKGIIQQAGSDESLRIIRIDSVHRSYTLDLVTELREMKKNPNAFFKNLKKAESSAKNGARINADTSFPKNQVSGAKDAIKNMYYSASDGLSGGGAGLRGFVAGGSEALERAQAVRDRMPKHMKVAIGGGLVLLGSTMVMSTVEAKTLEAAKKELAEPRTKSQTSHVAQ